MTCVVLHCLILSKADAGPQVCAMQPSERGQEGMGSAKQAFTSSAGGVGISYFIACIRSYGFNEHFIFDII